MNTSTTDIASVWTLLETVVDPEIPVLTVADLGIIRDVHLTEGGVEVVITVVRPCT